MLGPRLRWTHRGRAEGVQLEIRNRSDLSNDIAQILLPAIPEIASAVLIDLDQRRSLLTKLLAEELCRKRGQALGEVGQGQ